MSAGDRLTDDLLLGPRRSPVGPDDLALVRADLEVGVAEAVAGLAPGDLVEVSLATLRRAGCRPGATAIADEPFAWKPTFARRSLGLAAVRACLAGRFRAPADAVAPLADEALEEWRRTGWRTFHWEPWFAGLGPGGRAVVLAEAVTWATALWTAVDWTVLARAATVGGPDDLWTCPGPRTVRLKGRCEARLRSSATGPGVPAALVSLASGAPGPDWRAELGFLALTAGLRAPDHGVPSRVAGLWPETGDRHVVEVDRDVLHDAARLVVSTVGAAAAWRGAATGAGVAVAGTR